MRPTTFSAACGVMGVAFVFAIEAQGAAMTARIGQIMARPRSEVAVAVEATGAPGIGAMGLDVDYDPAILEIKSVDAGTLLEGKGLFAPYIKKAGRVVTSFATAATAGKGPRGDGVLFVMHFLVKGEPAQGCALHIGHAKAWNDDNELDILLTTTDGRLTVVSAIPVWLYVVAGVAVLVLLLVVFLAFGRRRARPVATPPKAGSVPGGTPCPKCGTPVPPSMRFCGQCGHAASPQP